MTSKIKVDNINKVSDDSNIINKCGTNITMGQNGDTVILPNGVTEQVQSGGAIQVQSGGSITIASGATITNNGTAVGLGRTGTVDWATTPVTATFTAANGVGYFCNTSGGAFTANLPAGVAGAIVSFADYAGTWQTNNVTVTPNGTDKIGSVNENANLNVEGQSVTFVFVDSTQGWINTMDSTSNVRGAGFICASVSGACNTLTTAPDCANVKIATFTGPGTFTVNTASSNAANNELSYMVVAGGAGGGGSARGFYSGGGGGAGGFREVKSPVTPYTASPLCGYGTPANRVTVTAQGYPIVIGGGGGQGGGSSSPNPPGCRGNGGDGTPTTALGITSTGGGGGLKSGSNPGAEGSTGRNGGSGGGGGGYNSTPTGGAGNGNTPPVSPAQGTNGGSGSGPSSGYGGGGGGAGGVGQSAPTVPAHSAVGGPGATTNITASPVAYARGGAGGKPSGNCTGAANTGNAGQGGEDGGSANGAAGGSGIVIIRYKFQ